MAPELTPPPSSPAPFLAWALGILVLVVIVVWRLREKDRNDTITLLKETITELKLHAQAAELKLEASEDRADALAERYASEVKSNARVLGRLSASLTVIAAAPPIKLPQVRADEDYDDTTGVSAAVTAQKRAEIDRILEAFHPNESDRPKPLPPRPRGKLPSRSG